MKYESFSVSKIKDEIRMLDVIFKKSTHVKANLIQLYEIKAGCDLQQVGGFLWILWFPPPIKLTITI
jgi:hypothetical protein